MVVSSRSPRSPPCPKKSFSHRKEALNVWPLTPKFNATNKSLGSKAPAPLALLILWRIANWHNNQIKCSAVGAIGVGLWTKLLKYGLPCSLFLSAKLMPTPLSLTSVCCVSWCVPEMLHRKHSLGHIKSEFFYLFTYIFHESIRQPSTDIMIANTGTPSRYTAMAAPDWMECVPTLCL